MVQETVAKPHAIVLPYAAKMKKPRGRQGDAEDRTRVAAQSPRAR